MIKKEKGCRNFLFIIYLYGLVVGSNIVWFCFFLVDGGKIDFFFKRVKDRVLKLFNIF